MEGSRCALLAVAIVTSAALVTSSKIYCPAKPGTNHGDSVADGSPSENPQSRETRDFNNLDMARTENLLWEKIMSVQKDSAAHPWDARRSNAFNPGGI
jgi:hypothetical protein